MIAAMDRGKPFQNGSGVRLRIGVIDTGVNPWHSHVRGEVQGCRIYLDGEGRIAEDGNFSDLLGHGTAVAGLLRLGLPDAEIFAVAAFSQSLSSYPSLVARAVLRAAAAGCGILNMSLGMLPGPGGDILAEACAAALDAGCVIVAAGDPCRPGLLPAALPGVMGVVADDRLAPGVVEMDHGRSYPYSACGYPRALAGLPSGVNLWGNSFACARVTVDTALRKGYNNL